jgi:hypothetical protein
MKKTFIFLCLIILSVVPIASVYADSDAGVSEAELACQSECEGFDHELKFDPAPLSSQTKNGNGNTITVTATWWKGSGQHKETIGFDWTASIGIGRVVVKASNKTREYGDWDPGHYSGSGVSVKKNPSGGDYPNNYYGISHITFCWNDEPERATASAEVLQCQEGNETQPVVLSVSHARMHVTGNGKDKWLHNETKTYYDWPAGTYSITYQADSGYLPPDGPFSFTIGVCEFGQAEASASVQQCDEGDVTEPVVLSVSHAKMFVTGNGKDEELHNETKTFNNWPTGTYSISYDPDPGYTAPDGPLSFTIGICDLGQAEASASVQACDTGDVTEPVILSVSHAKMFVTGNGKDEELHNESKTFNNWPAGTYSLSYEPDLGYSAPDGPLSFTIGICELGQAEASASVQQCDEGDVSEPVILSVSHAKMFVTGNGKDEELHNETKTFNDWPAGTYSLSYDPDPGYTAPDGPLSFTIGVCESKEDAYAEADPMACETGDVSTPVYLSVTGATMNVSGPGGYSTSLHNESKIIDGLDEGTYSLSYVMDPGYQDPGTLPTSFFVGICEVDYAEASAEVLACETGDVSTPVILSVTNATMNVSGPGGFSTSLHNESKTLDGLDEGTYSLSYVMDAGFEDPGNLPASFTIGLCEVEYAEATALVEACGIDDDTEPVSLSVSHATMHIAGPNGFTYDLTNDSVTLTGLEEGDYTLTYTLEAGFEDPGDLPVSFTIYPCEKGDEFKDLTLSVKCVFGDKVTHKWVVTNMNPFAVDFTWSAAASEGGYADSGSATVPALSAYEFNTKYVAQTMSIEFSDEKAMKSVTLTDGVCEEDKEPDMPAGALGPSALPLFTPAMIGISGTTLTWIMLKRKTKKSK